MFAYIGSRTTLERKARGKGIGVFKYHAQEGSFEQVQMLGNLENPSYLAFHPTLPVLYTVHGDGDQISALRIAPRTGELELWHSMPCRGRNPVHLALHASGRYLIVSNHLTGTLAVLPVDEIGALGEVHQLITLTGKPGPHRVEQPFSKPHFNPFDPSGRYVIVPDKGFDHIFTFEATEEGLSAAPVQDRVTRESAGPRHIAFHPGGKWAYVVNELDSTVTAYAFDAGSGALAPMQIVTTLPDTYTGDSRASGICVDETGRYVYASNRGYDSIAVFAIDEATGRLACTQIQPSAGRTPRFFSLSPDGRFLFVLNEDSDTVVRFGVDAQSGQISESGYQMEIGSPVCLLFR
jgi:6-phosphogluconolactonase (cycloisomerase 2 family)